ncbi:MAG: ABC transporter permease [Thermomicrobiales bacterium]|nr:ABC transporter permease [Thermomicrobiales bacterium]
MEKLFGIPMNTIMIVLLVLLFISLLAVIYVAIRRPVIFRMGMRNIPRRKTQSLLIVIGLMLATLISSAALTVGDTLNHSVGNEVYSYLGEIDQVVLGGEFDGESAELSGILTEVLPAVSVDQVRAAADGLEVDAVGGILVSTGPAISVDTSGDVDLSNPMVLFDNAQASEPMVGIVGADQQTFTDFKVTDTDSKPVDVTSLGADKVLVNAKLAENIDVGVGDTIVYVVGNQFYTAEVAGIVPTQFISGAFIQPQTAGMIVDLDHLRTITGQTDGWSTVLISNSGGVRGGVDHSEAVTDGLNERLADAGLNVNGIKADLVEQANLIGSLFVTMFIGFGLFSIAVGVLLIVLIFTMLAAERRGEMGMMRAIGGQRRQLVQQFLSEGAGYTLLSGLVGSALGVAVAWVIARATSSMTGGMFAISMYVHPRSLVIAYSLGVVITFAAVIFSSNRASRLNVVAALRDIPDETHLRHSKRPLVFAGIAILLGSWLMWEGHSRPSISLFLIGITLVPFALAAIAAWFGANTKLVLTLVGFFVLVVWGMPSDWFNSIFGNMGDGGIELFLLSGISMVAASTMIIMQQMDLLLRLVQMAGSRVKSWLAAVRLGVSYPRANGGRSGMTIAMFSLIVFSIVVMASVNHIFMQSLLGGDAMAGLDVRVDLMSSNQIDDVTAELENAGVNLEGVSAPARVDMVSTDLTQIEFTRNGETTWETGPLVYSPDETFFDLTQFRMKYRAEGFDSDQAVWEAMKTQPNLVLLPSSFATTGEPLAADPLNGGITQTKVEEIDKSTIKPVTVVMRGEDGTEHEFTVAGVIDPDYSMFFGLFLSTPTMAQLNPEAQFVTTSYYFTVDSSRDAGEVAADMERALLRFGAQGTDIAKELEEFQAQQSGFMTVLQWFMGLGLIVGVAAVGVIAYRAVVERRQQIGVLRALGFQASTIGRAFVIETAIIVVLGSIAGAILGLIVSYNLTNDPAMSGGTEISFQVPWGTLGVTLGLAIGMALLMSWLPARQASRTLPAEALRYE